MIYRLLCTTVVVTLASLPVPAQAQRPGGGMGAFDRSGLYLLTQDSVQQELKLAPDQAKQVSSILEKGRESFRGLREASREERHKKMEEIAQQNEAAVKGLLNADQLSRLKQISWQQRGGWALGDPDVAEALSLASDQKEKIASISQEARKEMRPQGQGGDRQKAHEKFQSVLKVTGEKLEAVLTPEQQAKWKQLQGEPFKGVIEFRGRGRA